LVIVIVIVIVPTIMTNQLIVTSLPFTVSGPQLLAWASSVVPAIRAEVSVDPITGRSRGTGIITFESVTDASRAQTELAGKPLEGKTVHLDHIAPENVTTMHQS
jgi:RNA recognition motif-containing protein